MMPYILYERETGKYSWGQGPHQVIRVEEGEEEKMLAAVRPHALEATISVGGVEAAIEWLGSDPTLGPQEKESLLSQFKATLERS